MRKNKTKALTITSGSLILMMLLNSCSSVNMTEKYSESTIDSTSIESTEMSSESILEESSKKTEETDIPTISYSCPVRYNDQLSSNFFFYNVDYAGSGPYDTFYALGWDNKLLNKELNDFLSHNYSINDGNYTIDNFHYFQYLQGGLSYHGGESISETVGWLEERERFSIIARSILQQEGLRYIIDEIPSSYFEERFPGFIDMYGDYETRQELLSRGSQICKDLKKAQSTAELIQKLKSLSEEDQFILYGLTIREYNEYRNAFMYAPGVKQVRNEITRQHVLVPDESQLSRIQNCLNDYEGYDFDITKTEDREHYFECFGIYPEEMIPADKIWDYSNGNERSR